MVTAGKPLCPRAKCWASVLIYSRYLLPECCSGVLSLCHSLALMCFQRKLPLADPE